MEQNFQTIREKYIQQNTKDRDDEIPWFRRKEMSVSDSAKSFKNKNLSMSMRLKHAFINLLD